jgi:hypothetical protein
MMLRSVVLTVVLAFASFGNPASMRAAGGHVDCPRSNAISNGGAQDRYTDAGISLHHVTSPPSDSLRVIALPTVVLTVVLAPADEKAPHGPKVECHTPLHAYGAVRVFVVHGASRPLYLATVVPNPREGWRPELPRGPPSRGGAR